VSTLNDELQELCAGYALGTLDDADRRRFEALLASGEHPGLEAVLAEFSEAAVLLASAATPVAPSASLKARVMAAAIAARAAVAGERESAGGREPSRGRVIELRPRGRGWTDWAWGAVAAALAIATALSWDSTTKLRAALESKRQEIAQLEQRLAEDQHWLEVLNAPDARVTELQITPAGVAALRARATFDPRTRSAVLVFENFGAPSGKDYQLWALRPDGVASLGLIRPDAGGRAVLKLENVGDPATLAGFAVSLEPEGGSPNPTAPTGPVVMAGKFGG